MVVQKVEEIFNFQGYDISFIILRGVSGDNDIQCGKI
jgi:hypothetical protein